MPPQKKKLLEKVRDTLRLKHCAYKTDNNTSTGSVASSSSITKLILAQWEKPRLKPS